MKEPKLLVISQNFPPAVSASSILVHNIFSPYKGKIEAIGGEVFSKKDNNFKPNCKTYYIHPPSTNYFIRMFYYKLGLRIRFINKILMK